MKLTRRNLMKIDISTRAKEGILEKKLLLLDEKILNLSIKFNDFSKKHKIMQYLIFAIYIVLISVVSAFHETWGDEAQAWVIARDCTYKEILFEIGHLEGHPSLWWLYLSLFAKTGFAYEIGIKLAAIILNTISAYLIIFKAPFHKIFNYTIPFTYFIFYQYGVISRCYSFLILGFVLCGIYYKKKQKSPLKMVFALLLLCMSGAYGLIFAFGISLIWVYEILVPFIKREINIGNKSELSRYFSKIKREIFALTFLLIAAIITLLLIIPYENTSGTYLENYNSLLFRLFYTFFLLPADSLVYSSYWGENYLGAYEISAPIMIMGTFIWLLILSALLTRREAKGNRKLLILPYFIFSAICANLYMYSHHIGIFALFILFWLWVCFSKETTDKANDKCNDKYDVKCNEKYNKKSWLIDGGGKLLYNTEWVIFAFMIIMPLSWSITSSYEDIIHNYTDSREVINFLEKYELTDSTIMKPGMNYEINGENRYEIGITSLPLVTAYLPKKNNTYRTFWKNEPANWVVRELFLDNNLGEEENLIKSWQNIGYPDVLIGDCDLDYVYNRDYQNEFEKKPKYICVKKVRYCLIFKGYYVSASDLGCTKIYLKKDLADKLNLKKVE